MKYSGIYKIRNLLNGKVYIGQSIDINNRFRVHKNIIRSTKVFRHLLYKAFNKYGIENFEFNVIEHVEDTNLLDQREQHWLDYYNSYNPEYGYNLRPKAESNRGIKLSDEHKLKIGLSNSGRKHNNETIKKMAETRRKLWQDSIYKNKQQTVKHKGRFKKGYIPYNKGKKLSEEHIKNISKGHLGQKAWNKGVTVTEEKLKEMSAISKKLWNDPEYRQKTKEAQKIYYKNIKNNNIIN